MLLKFQDSVKSLDRRMDTRVLEPRELSLEGDTVTMGWTVSYSKAELPGIALSGREVATFRGNAMSELRSVIDEESLQNFGAWIQAHGDKL